jgi:O-antigen/teichoic acid export membrane protein
MTSVSQTGGSAVRARLAQLTRLTFGYSLASLAGPIFTILLTPLYLRVLTPGDYAVLGTVTTLGILMLTLGTLGLNAAVAVFFYDGDEAHSRQVVTTAASVGVLWSLLVALVVALTARPLAAFSLGSVSQAILLYLAAFNLPFAVLYAIIQASLRLQMAVKRANILSLAYLGLTVSLNVLFVLVLRWGVLGIQLTTVIVTLGLMAAGLAMTWDEWHWPKVALVRPLVRAGLPFLPNSLSFWALAYVDRLLLPAFAVPLGERGLYETANKLASMLTLLTVPFQNAWGPLALSIREEPSAPRTYSKVLTYFTIVSLGLVLAMGLFAHEIMVLLAFLIGKSDYIPSAVYVAPLSYIAVANGIGVAVGVGAYIAKRTSVFGWTTMIGAALNLLLNLLLIPRFGALGAAWATALGYAVVPVALYVAAQRVYSVPFEVWKVLLALGVQAALMLSGTLFEIGNLWLSVAVKLALLGLYAVALLALHVVEPSEWRAIMQMLGRPRAMLATMVRR